MARTNAQRQAEYRERHLLSADGRLDRLNVLVPLGTRIQLRDIADSYGVTMGEALGCIVHAASFGRDASAELRKLQQQREQTGVTQ